MISMQKRFMQGLCVGWGEGEEIGIEVVFFELWLRFKKDQKNWTINK